MSACFNTLEKDVDKGVSDTQKKGLQYLWLRIEILFIDICFLIALYLNRKVYNGITRVQIWVQKGI